jgi:hypothetical protein
MCATPCASARVRPCCNTFKHGLHRLLTYSPGLADGSQLVAGVGSRVLVYDAADGDLLHALKGHKVCHGSKSTFSSRCWDHAPTYTTSCDRRTLCMLWRMLPTANGLPLAVQTGQWSSGPAR